MQEKRTPRRYVLVIDLSPAPTDGATIRYSLYGDTESHGLEFTSYIGCEIDLAAKPLEHIMAEVSWRLDQHPGINMIYLIGEFADHVMESLCREVCRLTKQTTSVLATEAPPNR